MSLSEHDKAKIWGFAPQYSNVSIQAPSVERFIVVSGCVVGRLVVTSDVTWLVCSCVVIACVVGRTVVARVVVGLVVARVVVGLVVARALLGTVGAFDVLL